MKSLLSESGLVLHIYASFFVSRINLRSYDNAGPGVLGEALLDIVVHLADGKLLGGVPVSDVEPLTRLTVFVDDLHNQGLRRRQHGDFADLKAVNQAEITIQLRAGVGYAEFIFRKLPQ